MLKFNQAGHFNINGIDIHPGSDVDAGVLKVNVTGTPTLIWDESESKFSINTGLNIIGSSNIVQQVIRANVTQTANILEIQKSDTTLLSGADERGILFSDGGIDVNSVYIGKDAGLIGATGLGNIGIGTRVLNSLTTGSSNVGLGTDALTALTGGTGNFGLGVDAGKAINTGTNNVAIGFKSLEATTSGSSNVAIGERALTDNITGGNNVSIGIRTLWRMTAGQSNTAIGRSAGGETMGNFNTYIGANAGAAVTSGDNNIMIGYLSGSRQTTNDNLLIIDNQQRADVATELTNSILYGVMAATPANQTLRINANTSIQRLALDAIYHIFGGFEDQAETITADAGVWTWITNGDPWDLWNFDEEDGISGALDVFTITNTGDYSGILSLSISGLTGKDFHVRVYNNTQARVEGRPIGISTTGANNEMNVALPIYIEATAGDEIQFEIMSTDGSDPTVDDALFYITYLHD